LQSRLLKYFLATVERKNITTAAEDLHITQPALTRSIHLLEKEVGATLFERRPTGVALTPQGEILARRARLMDLEYQHAMSELRAMQEGVGGTLRIGAGPVWVSSLLPPALATYYKQYPRVKVRVSSGVIDTLVPQLLAGEVDLICSTLDFPSQNEIVTEPIVRIRHGVVARRGHPLAALEAVTAVEMQRYPWVALEGDKIGTSRIGSYFVANACEPPKVAIETTAYGMMKTVLQGDFLAMLSDWMRADWEALGLVSLPMEGTFWEREAGIAHRRTGRPLRTLESFKAILRASILNR
jgi:DNA-binding transcriptional LysR family regulator